MHRSVTAAVGFAFLAITSAGGFGLSAVAAEPDSLAPAAPPFGGANGVASAGEPVGLRVTLCLWSKQRPTPLCREIALTPGAAGMGFQDNAACEAGKEGALNRWFREAREVFGFATGWAGEGYEIKWPRCAAFE